MKEKLKNILFVSECFPSKFNPNACPFIGKRMISFQEFGIEADMLSLYNIKLRERFARYGIRFSDIIKFLLVSIFPIVTFEKFQYLDKSYRIFRIHYNFISRVLMPFLLLLICKFFKYSLLNYHFLWFADDFVYIKKVVKIPSVLSIRGSDMHTTAANFPEKRRYYKKAVEIADKIFYVSNALRDSAKKIGLSTDKDFVIYNGFLPSRFHLTENNNKVIHFGFVGLLIERKRAEKLPEIFYYIKKKIPSAKLIIVGGGENFKEMKDYMVEKFSEFGIASDVDFAGLVPFNQIVSYYQKMDILLFPSRNEGFPNAVIEARACGVPVVGSSNIGVPEAVGNGGIIVEEGHEFEKRFAEAAIEYSKNLPSRKEIHDDVKELQIENQIRKEIEVYKEVLEKY